jgi:nitrite reductase/ring-hydroxylating ferredoxin subunit
MAWFDVCSVSDCSPGVAAEFVVEDRIVALFNVDGMIYALDGVCAHQGGPLGKGAMTACIVTCPWHGWQYDVRDGQSQLSPGIRQQTLETRCVDGRISVKLP